MKLLLQLFSYSAIIQLPYKRGALFILWEQTFINASEVTPIFSQISDKIWNVLDSMNKTLTSQLLSGKKDILCADNTD